MTEVKIETKTKEVGMREYKGGWDHNLKKSEKQIGDSRNRFSLGYLSEMSAHSLYTHKHGYI